MGRVTASPPSHTGRNWPTYKDVEEGSAVLILEDFFFQAVPDGVGELQQEQRVTRQQRKAADTLLTHLKVQHSTQFLITDSKHLKVVKIQQ